MVQHILLHLKTSDTDLGTQSRFDYVLHMDMQMYRTLSYKLRRYGA